ncbi:MAG: DUF4245 domain-containing protein [Pseudonocardiales bacterium]|nr:DUF4245 domain-containing protein [Pseudonocardiales bacterium]
MTSPSGPRATPGMKDIVIALAVLVPIILLVAGLTRACSFSPTGPSVETDRLPTVDASAELRSAAKRMPFEVRIPSVPAGWRANSASTQPVGGAAAVRVGWLTAQDRYLRLAQSAATESELVIAEVGPTAVASGPVEVAGQRWIIYTGGGRNEPSWVTEFAPTVAGPPVARVLITGSGTEEDIRVLAAAVSAGEVLAPG